MGAALAAAAALGGGVQEGSCGPLGLLRAFPPVAITCAG